MNPFEYTNSINDTKKNLIRGSESQTAAEKLYNSFITTRGLSYHEDTVMIANEINKVGLASHKVSKLQHYEFLLHAVPRRKRFGKWSKPSFEDDVELIQKVYGYSYKKARAVVDLFNEYELIHLRESQETGGASKR